MEKISSKVLDLRSMKDYNSIDTKNYFRRSHEEEREYAGAGKPQAVRGTE